MVKILWGAAAVIVIVLLLILALRNVWEGVLVFFIICILSSLFLPAVQSAREASRRTQAMNNLHMIGLAFANATDVRYDVEASIDVGRQKRAQQESSSPRLRQ